MILNQSTSFTMPKLTRDQQFKLCFGEFMENTCDIYYPDLKEWSLQDLTKNKSSSLHQDQLKIPAKCIIYTIDSYPDPITNIRQPGAVVEGDQEIPDITDFASKFGGYFEKFSKKTYGVVISYTSLAKIDKNDKGELEARIVVCYYKSYLPYPSKNKTSEQIQERCNFLESENTILNETIFDLNYINSTRGNKIKQLNKRLIESKADSVIKIRTTIDKMEAKIKELYKELGKQDECPVCYECIKIEELVAPGCCHYICGDCYDRCDICPICRDKYD